MKWHQINTRRISLQMCLFWNDGFNKKEQFTYGIETKNFLQFFDGKKTAYYVGARDWNKYKKGQHELLKQTKWIKTIPWEAQNFLELQLERHKQWFPHSLRSLSNQDLLALQQKIGGEVGWINSRTWMIYLINDVIVEHIRDELMKRLQDQKRVEELLLNFSTPLECNDAMNERMDLLRLAIDKKNLTSFEFESRLQAHMRRYRHIPMFGFDHDPFTIEHFRTELLSLTNPAVELEELQETMESRKESFETALDSLSLRNTDPLLDRIFMLKHTVFVRDYRDTLRQKMYLMHRSMYAEIGKRLGGISVVQTCNLTNEEIAAGLTENKKIDFQSLVRKRDQGFLLIEKNGTLRVYSGEEAHEKAKKYLGEMQHDTVSTITGVPASKGTAQGPARIVETNQDLHKVLEGDIMISQMTRQDFVPAMRKCAAIVTDEGSITNHAAIVSRELRIPCIVGTKVATQVLKDGDMIIVDAHTGTVQKKL